MCKSVPLQYLSLPEKVLHVRVGLAGIAAETGAGLYPGPYILKRTSGHWTMKSLTLSIKIGQKPYIIGSLGPKALIYESFEGKG